MIRIGKNIIIYLLLLGVFITPAVEYSFPSVHHAEAGFHHCCKEEQQDACTEAHHQKKCVVPCITTIVYLGISRIELTLSSPKKQYKKQSVWFYKNLKPQSANLFNWVPPEMV